MRDKLKLLPLLFYYSFVVLIFYSNNLWGDENRYVMFANNLLNGFYSPSDDINLWNGPGYPIILVPFVFFKLPWLAAKMFNALFLFLAVLYFYSTLQLYSKKRYGLLFAYLLGMYPPFLRHIHQLLTEPLSVFLVCGFLYHFCRAQKEEGLTWPHILAGSFFLGYLALTKIFFGYVILAGLLLYLIFYLWKRRMTYKKTLFVYFFALVCCLPYLFYTYSLTGKVYFWGNSGGMSWYWLSTPYDNELGDWQWSQKVYDNPELYKEHYDFFKRIKNMSTLQRDEEFRKQAVQNIINHPIKYLENVLANIGRLLFNYPFTHESQKISTYFFIIPNMFLVVAIILCAYPAFLGRRLIPDGISGVILFGMIAFAGSSLLSAYNRQLWPLVPVFCLWIYFVLAHLVEVRINKNETIKEDRVLDAAGYDQDTSSGSNIEKKTAQGIKLLKTCAVSLGIFIMFIGIVEAVLRTTHLFGSAISYTEPDPLLGNRYTGGASYWFHKEGPHPVTGKMNSHGYRDKEWQLAKPDNTYRIAVLGDSYVEALQVESEKTFLSKTEHDLNSIFNGDYHVELMNFGHSGYTQSHELIQLKREVSKFSPDLVVLFFLPGNDIDDISSVTARNLIAPFYSVSPSDELILDTGFNKMAAYRTRSFINWFKQRSALLSLIANRFNAYVRDRRVKQIQVYQENREDRGVKGYLSLCTDNQDPRYVENYSLNKRLIREMSDYSKERGTRFMLVTINMEYYIPASEEKLKKTDHTFNVNFFEDDLKDFAEKNGMEYLGLQRIFRDAFTRDGYKLHTAHWNYKGHEVVADTLTKKLKGIILRQRTDSI